MMTLAERLQKSRIDAHLDIFIVAHKLGIHYTQIRAWEAATKEVTVKHALELAVLYGIDDLKWLFSGDLDDNEYRNDIPIVETPQIAYDLSNDQIGYLSALHWGLPSIGQALSVMDYLMLVDLKVVENEALTAHGDWYCEQFMEVTS